MAPMFQLGQVLKGKLGSYELTRKLQDTVWLALNQRLKENVIVKHLDHYRTGYEREAHRRFQHRNPHIRPLLDEIQLDGESEWPALVLKWLDDDMLSVTRKRSLTRDELKRVGRGALEALAVLHEDGFVHTDVKSNNILVNLSPVDQSITDVQLADLDSTVHEDSSHAKNGDGVGTPIFRSTEAILQTRWGTPTDIWSFGITLTSLIYADNFHLLKPDVPVDHEDYHIKILLKQNQFFGPFPLSYMEIADEDRLEALTWIVNGSKGFYTPFKNITSREIPEEDKQFLLKILKLDPRDRPSAKKLLADEWFAST